MLKYEKIDNLHRNLQVLQHEVVVTEKIHGTNARIMYDNNKGLILGSRNNIIYSDDINNTTDGYGFVDYILSTNWEKIKNFPNYTFYGEFHGGSIQKGVKYCDSNKKDLRIFDIRDPYENFISWIEVEKICAEVGFKTVPVLYKGFISLEKLNSMIDVQSIVALENGLEENLNNIAEGLVIKPIITQKDKRGNWLIAKYKSNKWAESVIAAKTKRPSLERANIQLEAQEFANSVVTFGRVSTAIEHITRDGDITLNVYRTGDFLRALIVDIMEEFENLYSSLDKAKQNIYNKTINGIANKMWQDFLKDQ